jgi:beta-glucuronidase
MRSAARRNAIPLRRFAVVGVPPLGSPLGLLLALVVLMAGGASTAAAASPAYPPPYAGPTPPTKGALQTDGPNGRYLLGGAWLYQPDPGNVGVAQGWWRDVASTAGWGAVTIPNSYNAGNFSGASMYGYVGWYRRDFTLPRGAFNRYVPTSARSWVLQFESINYSATVWLNGHRLGSHAGAYLPFEFTLKYLRSGVNRLVVRVDDRRDGNSFPAGPSGGWWNFGGILDAVYLQPVQRADVDSVLIRPRLPCPTCSAAVAETATVRNLSPLPQTVSLSGTYGSLRFSFGTTTIRPGGTWRPQALVAVRHPKLWSIGKPNLYRATVRLADARRRTLGGYTFLSGIRQIERTRGGRLELNGRLLDLRGLNMHEQDITTGAALTVAQLRQRLAWVRALGGTIIREHYPLDPEAEEMADRLGILLWSEVPVYNIPSANFGDPVWRQSALALIKANIAANQDHPSILLWSIGNEFPTPATSGEAGYIALAAAEVKALDPTRPVAAAVSDWPGVPCQAAYAPLDVIGVNEYFGWFDAGGGTTDDRDGLSPFLDSVRQCYPHQALMITEFGFNGNRDGPAEDRGTYAFQSNSLAYHLSVFDQKSWLSGAIWFNLQDFAAKPGYDGSNPGGTPPFVTNGMVDLYGNPKPAFSVMAQMYRAVQQIAPVRRQ